MSTQEAKAAEFQTVVGGFFARRWRLLQLWRDDNHRRDAWRLLLAGLRGLVGLRFAIAIAILVCAGGYMAWTSVSSAADGFRLLTALFGVATILGAAPIYAADQRQGTFELLWLASGSQAALLRMKVAVLMLALFILMVPSVILTAWFLAGTLPVVKTLLFLLTNSLFIIGVMAFAGTFLPQAWAGGLLGTVALAGLYLGTGDAVSVFNLFLNPFGEAHSIKAGGGAFEMRIDPAQLAAPNRLFAILAAIGLLYAAQRRLRRAFT